MNACEVFCQQAQTALGPALANVVLGALGLALVWWRARKHTAAVVEPLAKRAEAAERALVEIRDSLRPPQ